ncbi:hypothetical protein ACOMHN_016956 [Nucella lapillus]
MPATRTESGGQASRFTTLPPIDLGWNDRAEAVVGSLVNVEHVPRGGDKAIPRKRVRWEAKAKVGSMDNVHYKDTPRSRTSHSDTASLSRRRRSSMLEASARYSVLAKCGALGPQVEETTGRCRQRYRNVPPRVGSLDNIAHVPGGGETVIQHRRTRWKAEARVGSLDNVHHIPGGGDSVTVNHRRLSWLVGPRVGSLDNISHAPQLNPIQIPRNKTLWAGRARVGSLDNIHHLPGGGVFTIPKKRLRWNAQSKVDTNPPNRRNGYASSSSDSVNDSRKAFLAVMLLSDF